LSSGDLARRPEAAEAPLVVTRVGRPAELDRFPGGSLGRLGMGTAGVLLAIQGPDLVLGAGAPFWGRLLVAAGLGALAPTLIIYGLPWLRKRRMRRVVAWDGVGQPPGEASADMNVRLVGTIEAVGTPFVLPETAGPLVYARTRFHEVPQSKWASAPAVEDVRGVPFQVRVSEQTAVRLPPELLRPLDEPVELWGKGDEHHRALGVDWPGQRLGPITRVAFAPGDKLEVVGRLHRQVAPEGQSAPGRGVPFVLVAGPAWDGSVWVRRLP
jgi:hypothetical protein